ncbi:MAG: Imm52 family immunity protein [Rhizomicrobium sp.]|jgi:hypothetical protein
MSEHQFDIVCLQDWHPQTPAEIGRKFLETLDALSQVDRHFDAWQILDDEKETSIPLERVRADISQIVERGASKGDDGEPEPQMGYRVRAVNRFVNSDTDPFSVEVGMHAGGNAGTTQSISFSTEYGQIPAPSIVAFPVVKTVLLAFVNIWNSRNGSAYSRDLMDRWDDPRFKFELYWLTYLDVTLATQITVPPDVCMERTADGGILLIATEETFNTANPDHMAAARRIRDAMAPLNDLAQHERDKQASKEIDRMLEAIGAERVTRRGRDPSSQ